MKLKKFLLYFQIIFIFGCNIYKSDGREQFEYDSTLANLTLYSCSSTTEKIISNNSEYTQIYISDSMEVLKSSTNENLYSINYYSNEHLTQSCLYEFKKNLDGKQFISKIIQQSEHL